MKDLENFSYAMKALPVEGQLNVAKRLGWLNILNAMDMDRTFDLRFKHHDHRVVVNVLLKLR